MKIQFIILNLNRITKDIEEFHKHLTNESKSN